MKKLLAGLIALLLLASPVLAQQNVNPGIYDATPDTIIDGQRAPMLLDSMRRQVVVSTSGGVAVDLPFTGTPDVAGCVYRSTFTAVADGDVQTVVCNSRGAVRVQPEGNLITATDDIANTSIMVFSGVGSDAISTQRPLSTAPWVFDGTNWDRDFTCGSTAVINVTAAATTQIVGLVASQVIRVCSFAVTMSAAGTAQFVTGTGTNCATGLTALTGAMPLATGTPLELSAGSGSLFRSLTANAICVAAVTGNVVGFMTYAQY